jgi:hypothetical protein
LLLNANPKPLPEKSIPAIAGYCFSPLFGLFSALRDFTALHSRSLKARGSKGDSGNFLYKTRVAERLEFKSPLSARILYPPHLHEDASCEINGLLSGLVFSFGCARSPIL